ncbi:hypothetical protein KFE98_09705 [bacterium SCSIO 12741]|nr:hypothetical protein KFE98_09705 [bacterium SCSIO 12741]
MKNWLYILLVVLMSSCIFGSALPEGEEYKFEVGEIVYYKTNHQPMLIDKRIYKKGEKRYKVVFKNESGELLHNEVTEDEVMADTPINRARI